MWNESATSARECTAYPTMISKKKKMVSITRSVMIRVERESPIVVNGCDIEGTGGGVEDVVDLLVPTKRIQRVFVVATE